MIFNKIILPSRPQPDTIIGIFLLRAFGKEKYPDIDKAKIEIWQELPKNETSVSLENRGVLALDIGQGKFDHHQRNTTLSKLIAEDLNIIADPCLQKLLAYGERDDKYGLGTISSDSLDKAFGLSGLITSLNKGAPENPERVIEIILPIITAHCIEEKKRTVEIPKEFDEKFSQGKVDIFEIKQGKKEIKVISLESNNLSMAGWLKSGDGKNADVVCQKNDDGYVNILTKPLKKIDLRWTAAYLRNEESKIRNKRLNCSTFDLMMPGKVLGVPEWYYDRATNSILNGGTNPNGIEPTAIPFERIREILKESLAQDPPENRPMQKPTTSQDKQSFLEIRLPIEAAKEIKQALTETPAGIKAHMPENYHVTLVHFPKITENFYETTEKIKNILKNFKPFEISINEEDLKSGIVPGYPIKAFYFEIGDKSGGNSIKTIRKSLEDNLSGFQKIDFIPHLTVASALPQINEQVIKDSEIKLDLKKEIKFLVEKIRLTEVSKNPSGMTQYKTKGEFYL
jgi:2'-5' RNA ligase